MSRKRRLTGEPDIEIGAAARARRLRFRRKPETKVEFEGRTRMRSDDRIEEVELESDSGSERRNLPEEVEPGVTYRNVEVGWAAGARAVIPEKSRAEKHRATEAAMRQAGELGVDLNEIEGSGAEGRITVRDVKRAAEEQ